MFFYYWQIVYLKKKKKAKIISFIFSKETNESPIEENQNGIPS